MTSTKAQPTGVAGAKVPATPLADCTPLLSLAVGAAGVRRPWAPGAVGGGDRCAAGGTCAPTATVAPRRPTSHASVATELHPRPPIGRRGTPALSGPHSHEHGPAREAGQEERVK